MSAVACVRCGAKLRDAILPCGTCRADRIEVHVRTLVAGASSRHSRVLKAKADAIAALRSFGFTEQQVLEVRAKILDGKSVQEILNGLLGAGEAVPA